MEKTNLTRRFFQILIFLIFLIQVYNSILKYNDGMIIQKQTTISIDDIKQPDIFVCLDINYDYTKSLSYGYEYMTSLFTGNLKDSVKTTWKGKYKNLTFWDIRNDVYLQEFGNFTVKNEAYKKTFSTNLGYCMHLENTSSGEMTTTSKLSVLMVDPNNNNDNEVMIDEIENARVTFGPTADHLFDFLNIEIRISLYDARIRDGVSCTDYDKINSSYGQCITGVMRERLLRCFGCLPLWFPDHSGDNGCEVDKDVHVQDEILYQEVFQEMSDIISGWEVKYLDICLPPCKSMAANFRKTAHMKNFPSHGILSFKPKRDVVVYTDICSYDGFSLAVDFGSAIGLWLGLCAFNILDFILTTSNFLCQKAKFLMKLF